ncbi:MAG: hypothetical protein ACRD0K_21810, partial [Egibacteraceae bacterium]
HPFCPFGRDPDRSRTVRPRVRRWGHFKPSLGLYWGQIRPSFPGQGLARAMRAHQHDDSYRQLAAQLSQDEAKLLELSDDYYSTQLISRAEFIRQRDLLERCIATARVRLAATAAPGVLAGLPAEEAQLRAWWDNASGGPSSKRPSSASTSARWTRPNRHG